MLGVLLLQISSLVLLLLSLSLSVSLLSLSLLLLLLDRLARGPRADRRAQPSIIIVTIMITTVSHSSNSIHTTTTNNNNTNDNNDNNWCGQSHVSDGSARSQHEDAPAAGRQTASGSRKIAAVTCGDEYISITQHAMV